MSNVRVCVDVVGGDEKPQVVLDGIEAALAADPDIEVLAVGPAEIVNPFAAAHARVEALEAPDIIAMDDDPIRAVMTKRKSSIVLACRAIKKGNADAFFSAGSTGAMTAAATAYVTPFRYQAEGKKQPVRPCLTNALPNRAGGLTVLCDMGANPDVEVDDMVRFAQMGSAYARVVLGIEHPRVGLLANGTEDEKGSNFTKACFPAMKAAVPGFVGNCEGTDLTSGNFDVVVADGMSGNIALKATEGAAKFLLQELKGVFMSSLGTKIAALLIKKQMREIKAKLSGDAKGGAILLGLRGVVLIGHGATSVEAVKNGTLAARTTKARRSTRVLRSAPPQPNTRLRRPKPCAPGWSRMSPTPWTASFCKSELERCYVPRGLLRGVESEPCLGTARAVPFFWYSCTMRGSAMDRSEIFDKIAEVAADVLGVDVAEISDETTFDDLDANSLERLQLVTAIEDEFNLEIDDETLLSLNSVADAVDAIENAREA